MLLGLTIGLLRLLTIELLWLLTVRRLLTVRLLTIGLLTIGLLRIRLLTVRRLTIGLLRIRLLTIGLLRIRLLTVRLLRIRLLILLLHLHLLHIGIGSAAHKVACCAHAHANAHESCRCAVRIRTCVFDTSCNGGLNEGLTHTRIVIDRNTVSLLQQLFGVVVIGDLCDTHILDLKTTVLSPDRIERVTHIFYKLCCLGRDSGQRLTQHRNAAERFAESAEIFRHKGIVEEFVNFQSLSVCDTLRRDHGIEEFPRLYDLNGERTERTHHNIDLIMLVIIRNRRLCAKLDTFHRAQVDIDHSLLMVSVAAKTDPVPSILQRSAEISVKERRRAGIFYFIVSGDSRIVHDSAAVYQTHQLT